MTATAGFRDAFPGAGQHAGCAAGQSEPARELHLRGRPGHERGLSGENKAALFVSVHANAAENKSANGVEVFYFSKKSSPYAERIANFENSIGEKYGDSSDKIIQISGELAYKKNQENSIRLAKKVVENIADRLSMRNGGVHGANFAVLRGFNGTGVLIELGFVSNSYDAEILVDPSSQQKMAEEIAKSIREYLTR